MDCNLFYDKESEISNARVDMAAIYDGKRRSVKGSKDALKVLDMKVDSRAHNFLTTTPISLESCLQI